MADTSPLDTVRTVADLRARVRAWRNNGETVGLVPTMGALHEGHLSLVRRSRELTTRTIVTLFVNPKQFAPSEDLSVYPRDEASDAGLLADVGADLLFAPGVAEMYPSGSVTEVHVPQIGDVLEGECRPGFFTGVATVVTKLLLQALPDVAVFGEKDYQQLQVIQRMVTDLDIPVRIEGCPTVREDDGLAMSSRNAYLSDNQRRVAPVLFKVMNDAVGRFAKGLLPADVEAKGREELLAAGFNKVDYFALRDAASLGAVGVDAAEGASRLLVAAWLGNTRLIDNIAV